MGRSTFLATVIVFPIRMTAIITILGKAVILIQPFSYVEKIYCVFSFLKTRVLGRCPFLEKAKLER